MTETKGLEAETTLHTRFSGEIQIGTTTVLGESAAHIHLDGACADLDRHEVLAVVNALLRAEDVIGFPDDAPFPPVEVRTLPADALVFLGVNA